MRSPPCAVGSAGRRARLVVILAPSKLAHVSSARLRRLPLAGYARAGRYCRTTAPCRPDRDCEEQMPTAIVTGSGGLIGSETARFFAGEGLDVIGCDNDMRAYFFGPDASTKSNSERLARDLGDSFRVMALDIRDRDAIDHLFAEHG